MPRKREFRGRIPTSQYERLLEKYPGDAEQDDLSDGDILLWMIPEFLRLLELEEMRATRQYTAENHEN